LDTRVRKGDRRGERNLRREIEAEESRNLTKEGGWKIGALAENKE